MRVHVDARSWLVQQPLKLLAHGTQTHSPANQSGCSDGCLLAQNAEQQMLGADVIVREPVRFLGGEMQTALHLLAERNLDGGKHFLAENGPSFEFTADVVLRNP
jgi:hypothetical protein